MGTEYELEDAAARLVDLAYARVEMVEKRGEFAVRGGIVDLFPPTAAQPVRVEFWGDEVSELRCFSVADQRSLPAPATSSPRSSPRRAASCCSPTTVRARAAELAAEHTRTRPCRAARPRRGGHPVRGHGVADPGCFGAGPSSTCCPSCCRPAGTCWSATPSAIRTRAADLVRTGQEFLEASWLAAADGGDAPIDLGASAYRDLDDVRAVAAKAGTAVVDASSLATDPASRTTRTRRRPRAAPGSVEAYRGDIARAADRPARARRGRRGTASLVVPAAGTAQRAAEQLREHEVPVHAGRRAA